KRAYCLKTQPATGETYPKSDLFNKAGKRELCVFFYVTVNLRIWRADARAVSVYYQFQWICDMYNFAKPRVLQPNR
ncbi:hypothetical protein ACRFDU_24565, partial [Klebsiella pneumoniae]